MNAGRWLLMAVVVLASAVLSGCGGRWTQPTKAELDAFFDVVAADDVKRVTAMLAARPLLVNAADEDGYTPLMIAAENEAFAVMRLLLLKRAKADVADPGWDDVTPLHCAARAGDEDLMKMLFVCGADPNRRTRSGETPLEWAVQSGEPAAVEFLLSKGADAESVERAILEAAVTGRKSLLEFLMTARKDPDAPLGPTPEIVDRAILDAALAGPTRGSVAWTLYLRSNSDELTDDEEKAVAAKLKEARAENEETVAWLCARRPDPKAPFAFWKAASGTHPDRMNLTRGDYLTHTVYSALWKRGDEEYLVRIPYPGCELFGTPYNIVVLDRTPRVVSRGEMTMSQDHFPYALVEVFSKSKHHPGGLRGTWTLGVANLWWKEEWDTCDPALDLAKPIHVVGWNVPHDDTANAVDVELIQWEDGAKLRYGSGNLSDLEDVKFRWAEPGPCVFDNLHPDPPKE